MKVYDFTIEYQKNPKGLAVRVPRFSWKMESDQQNVRQKSYEIQVVCGQKTVWDSGIILSEQSVLVPYSGSDLEPEQTYQVCLKVEDNYGNQNEFQTEFTTGIFEGTSFAAKMITHDFPEEETACPIFSKRFQIKKKIKYAYLYATAHGVYDAEINGKKVGDAYMAPGWTEYQKRLQYQFYDIAEYLQEENEIDLTVGNGWYKGILSFDCKPNRYGNRVEVFAEIHIGYEDGEKETIATDRTWQVKTGAIRYSEIYNGETLDTFQPEIRTGSVKEVPFDKQKLTAQECEPVRVTERLAAKRVWKDPKGNVLVDFGQNLTGLVEVKIRGGKGQKIKIRHAELLDKDGVFYPDTLRTARSEDVYILNGEEQVLMPHFTFHGFRYIAVEGIDNIQPEMFTACVMHSDMEQIGSFHCSNEKVNQLQSNITWSFRDNFFDIPSDCPQRDERLGWMGDAQVFSWTAAFNRNTARFFTKWMRDISAASSLEQGVPHIVPDIQGTYSSAAWSDAAVIIPWVVYQTYGDKRILEESWKCMHEWVDYIQNHTNEDGLWMCNYQYGDWLALDREEGEGSVGATDVYLVANAYYLYVTDIVRQTAEVLGKEQDAADYRKLYADTLESFREEYYTSRGRIVSETQTGCVLSLYFHLAREKDKKKIVQTLVSNIEDHKTHLTTGFVGTPYLCHALSENGAHETAAAVFMKEDYPSWLYAVNKGATTIWERWNGIYPDGTMPHPGLNSMNHYANGSIGDWIYRKIGGISQMEAGYKTFSVKPMFVRGIEETETVLESPYGQIRSYWRCKNKRITVSVSVPANTTAWICLPEKEQAQKVGSGVYTFEYETETSLKVWKYSLDSTLGEIMETPLGNKLLNEMLPELMANPMIEYAKKMTLSEGCSAVPGIKAVYEKIVQTLNAAEEDNSGDEI